MSVVLLTLFDTFGNVAFCVNAVCVRIDRNMSFIGSVNVKIVAK